MAKSRLATRSQLVTKSRLAARSLGVSDLSSLRVVSLWVRGLHRVGVGGRGHLGMDECFLSGGKDFRLVGHPV